MRAISIIIMAVVLSGCMPNINQTTWSTSNHSGQVTLSAAFDNAQRWATQCDSQRKGLELGALGMAGLSVASGVGAGASLTMEGSSQTAMVVGSVLAASVAAYLGMRTWYGARLYSKICMAYEGEQQSE